MEEYQPKFTSGEWIALLLAAMMFDAITWIPVIGTIINFFATAIFWFIFWIKSTHLGIIKKIANFLVPGFIEFIPLINVLPVWTASIALAYFVVKMEEKHEKTEQSAEKQPPKIGKLAKAVSRFAVNQLTET